MKKIIISIFVALLFFSFIPLSARAERIDSFKTILSVQEDTSILVTEEIVYDLGEMDRHGIYRTIPYQYQRNGNTYNLRINVLSVVDEDGQSYKYKTYQYGGYFEIRIGDADAVVSGVHTYVIKYQVWRALNFFDDHDELYWNTSGNEWDVPIMFHEVEVEIPEVARSGLQATCFTGFYGDVSQNCSQMKSDKGFYFAADKPFEANEGMSVVVGWSPGAIVKPGIWQEIKWFLFDNWGLFFPIPVGIFMFFWWRRYGKDEFGRGTIIPMYEPPRGLNPAEVGTAVDGHAHLKDLSSTIIDLAQRGYLKIKYKENKRFFGVEKDYELTRIKPSDSLAKKFDREFYQALFGSKETVAVSKLKNNFYKKLPKLSKILNDEIMENGYFTMRPDNVRTIYILVGIAISVIGGILMAILTESFANSMGLVVSGLIVAISAIFMAKRTREGAIIREEILGFQNFLKVTEKDRLEFHNSPEKKPEQFEKLLAYAMVLGVENEWAGQFKDIYTTPPNWFDGGDGHTFTTAWFVSSLSSFDTTARSAMTTRPGGGAGAGSSGFSGGGFSGGGFGGGGGGSW